MSSSGSLFALGLWLLLNLILTAITADIISVYLWHHRKARQLAHKNRPVTTTLDQTTTTHFILEPLFNHDDECTRASTPSAAIEDAALPSSLSMTMVGPSNSSQAENPFELSQFDLIKFLIISLISVMILINFLRAPDLVSTQGVYSFLVTDFLLNLVTSGLMMGFALFLVSSIRMVYGTLKKPCPPIAQYWPLSVGFFHLLGDLILGFITFLPDNSSSSLYFLLGLKGLIFDTSCVFLVVGLVYLPCLVGQLRSLSQSYQVSFANSEFSRRITLQSLYTPADQIGVVPPAPEPSSISKAQTTRSDPFSLRFNPSTSILVQLHRESRLKELRQTATKIMIIYAISTICGIAMVVFDVSTTFEYLEGTHFTPAAIYGPNPHQFDVMPYITTFCQLIFMSLLCYYVWPSSKLRQEYGSYFLCIPTSIPSHAATRQLRQNSIP